MWCVCQPVCVCVHTCDIMLKQLCTCFLLLRTRFLGRLHDLRQLCSSALLQSVWVLDRWYIRLAAVIGFVLALISTVINMVLVPIVNYQMMPGWQQVASQATQRQVRHTFLLPFTSLAWSLASSSSPSTSFTQFTSDI